MSKTLKPPALDPSTLAPRIGSGYPAPFAAAAGKREKRALGDALGLTHFGVNLTTLPPGCWSSQRHWHTASDELVYVLEGELVLETDAATYPDVDLAVKRVEGKWVYTHKDGTPY